jgi:hypothetical protein
LIDDIAGPEQAVRRSRSGKSADWCKGGRAFQELSWSKHTTKTSRHASLIGKSKPLINLNKII